jgi:hypothetical protein
MEILFYILIGFLSPLIGMFFLEVILKVLKIIFSYIFRIFLWIITFGGWFGKKQFPSFIEKINMSTITKSSRRYSNKSYSASRYRKNSNNKSYTASRYGKNSNNDLDCDSYSSSGNDNSESYNDSSNYSHHFQNESILDI